MNVKLYVRQCVFVCVYEIYIKNYNLNVFYYINIVLLKGRGL